MLRHYYITLCGKRWGFYVDVFSQNKDNAYKLALFKYGSRDVSRVYTENAWKIKNTSFFSYLGKIENTEEKEYLRRKKIAF